MPASFQLIRMATACALLGTLICALFHAQPISAHPPQDPGTQDRPDVLRVYTELVQTDVMVFDRQGKFVKDLKKEDFELRIDGKSRPVEFFERITAGSQNEESQLAAARGAASRRGNGEASAPVPLDRGRPVFFYIDDLHLDPSSVKRTRDLLTRFVDHEMGQNDEAAIASASGQIGFLQQLTDNKTVLRGAISRLVHRNYSVTDHDRPLMTEYQALRIDAYDRDVTDYFVEETRKENPHLTPDAAKMIVQSRAHALLSQAGRITSNTLAGLETLVRSAKTIPGRKLVFFLSDGFFLDRRNSDADTRLQRITSAAAKSGIVIYSIDARGLVTGMPDASSAYQFDPSGRISRGTMGEVIASQDGLNALAKDTGGKAFFNSNSLEPAVKRALNETSTYYLLAWKPDQEARSNNKFRRIEVKVAGKPELTVQVRRGFFDIEPTPVASQPSKPATQTLPANLPRAELLKVMNHFFPNRDLPIALGLQFMNVPDKGSMLSATMQVPREFFTFSTVEGKPTAVVDVGGTFFNAKGQIGEQFTNRITITATDGHATQDLVYGHPVFLPPGLYQVRVGARDENSGRAGSAHAWIEIPDLSKGQLALSSVIVGARPASLTDPAVINQKVLDTVALSVDRRFSNGDYLRFMIIVYNAARAPSDAKPDAAIQVQIVRDDQPVVTTPLKKISTDDVTDFSRLGYAAEVSLAGLPPGRYLLRVTAVDRVTKTSASQQTRFEIQ